MSEKQTNKEIKHTAKGPTKIGAIGAVAVAALITGMANPGLAVEAKDRAVDIVSDAWNEEAPEPHNITVYSPNGKQGETIVVRVGEENNQVSLTFDKSKYESVFDFAAKNLEGNAHNYTPDLKKQLERDGISGYDAPDGYTFEVEPEDLTEVGETNLSNPHLGSGAEG